MGIPTIPRQLFNMEKKISFYVASCVPDGGVYLCELDVDGNVEMKKVISAPSPMWIEHVEDGKLWVLMRAPFEDSPNSGVAKYDPVSGERISNFLSTEGEVACHMCLDGDDLYAANYISGSVWSSRGEVDKHSGKGVDPVRQTSPHVHSVFFSPDKKYILSCDLGIDKIFVYDRNMKLISTADTPEGSGARHLVFSKDGNFVYVISEMGAGIHTYAWSGNALLHLCDTELLDEDVINGKGSAIRLSKDGRRLYVTERKTETILVFSICGDKLTLLQRIPSRGKEPRDIMLIANEDYAICANQFGDCCSVYKILNDGTLNYVRSFEIPAPISIVE